MENAIIGEFGQLQQLENATIGKFGKLQQLENATIGKFGKWAGQQLGNATIGTWAEQQLCQDCLELVYTRMNLKAKQFLDCIHRESE